jgi:hypothetical protein
MLRRSHLPPLAGGRLTIELQDDALIPGESLCGRIIIRDSELEQDSARVELVVRRPSAVQATVGIVLLGTVLLSLLFVGGVGIYLALENKLDAANAGGLSVLLIPALFVLHRWLRSEPVVPHELAMDVHSRRASRRRRGRYSERAG